ncbi:unnamed protein product [Symbiodinium sp. CCMP2456]|nr:unnamed protein product [Symbiodinium sp. CCMP2456]
MLILCCAPVSKSCIPIPGLWCRTLRSLNCYSRARGVEKACDMDEECATLAEEADVLVTGGESHFTVCKAYRDALRLLCDCVPVKEAKEGTEARLTAFYAEYRPERLDEEGKVKDIKELFERLESALGGFSAVKVWKKWQNREPELFFELAKKYSADDWTASFEEAATAVTEDQRSWRVWHGAWSPSMSSRDAPWQPGPKAKAKSQPFPSYDQSWGQRQDITVVKETRHQGSGGTVAEDGMSKPAQHAVNALRKAEARVSRIAKEKQEKAARFAAYEKEVQAAHALEEKKYMAAQERLAAELDEATEQQAAAKAEPTATTRRGQERNPKPADVAPEDLDPQLLEILRSYKQGLLTIREPLQMEHGFRNVSPVVLRGPVSSELPQARPGDPAPSYGPVSPGSGSALVRSAPFPPTSPSHLHHVTENKHAGDNVITSLSPEASHREHRDTGSIGVRQSIKDSTKAPPEKPPLTGTPLHEKLEAKRGLVSGLATRPFGLPPVPEDAPPGLAPRAACASALVDDDHEKDDGGPSPGFGNLE